MQASGRKAIGMAAALIVSVAVPGGLTYKAMRRITLDNELIVAVKRYDAPQVAALLNEGADPNARDNQQSVSPWDVLRNMLAGKSPPVSGPTALEVVFDTALMTPDGSPNLTFIPLRKEPVALIRELTASGANVNVKSYCSACRGGGDWPLIFTPADMGWADTVQIMLDKGADCNAHSSDHATLLQVAIQSGNVRLAKTLIARGANVNAKDDNRDSPLQTANLYYNSYIIEALKKAGAKE